MSKRTDMLGRLMLALRDVPSKMLGLILDIVNKLSSDHGEIFYTELAKFARDWRKDEGQVEKFAPLADLDIITVPEDYVHETRLADFRRAYRGKFHFFSDDLTDVNFPRPSRVLKPGDQLAVTAYKQIVFGTTTSEERVAFLKSQGAVFTGAQGASLVFEQKCNQLPKGLLYTSFDEKDHLWVDATGGHRVPGVGTSLEGEFGFSLGLFEEVWYGGGAILGFRDLPK